MELRSSPPAAGALPLNHLLLQFSYLQALDFLTTIAFLLNGVREANPVVRAAMNLSPDPVVGLLAVKVAGILLGLCCWWLGKGRLLFRMNMFFALVVAWNLLALIAGSAR